MHFLFITYMFFGKKINSPTQNGDAGEINNEKNVV